MLNCEGSQFGFPTRVLGVKRDVERHGRSQVERNSKQGIFDSHIIGKLIPNSTESVFSYKLISKSNLKGLPSATSENPSEASKLDKPLNV